MGQALTKSFDRHSSPVDWCEPNYVKSPVIAEYWNTLSNLVFISLPVSMLFLFGQYRRLFGPGMHFILPLLVVVGLSSIYFHTTLSLAGQMLDELSIFWSLCAGVAAFLPKKYFPLFQGNRKLFSYAIGASSILLTGVLLLEPYLNAFVLMFSVVPLITILYKDTKRNKRLHRLSIRSAVTCIVAVAIWILDRVFCSFWLHIGFPYLHAIWHILIVVPACAGCVMGAFMKIRDETTGYQPELKYWPINDIEVGVPYILVREDSCPNK